MSAVAPALPETPHGHYRDAAAGHRAAVREAIEYCKAHWDVVLKDHANEERLSEATGMNHPDYKYNPKKYYKPLTPQERAAIFNDESLPGRGSGEPGTGGPAEEGRA